MKHCLIWHFCEKLDEHNPVWMSLCIIIESKLWNYICESMGYTQGLADFWEMYMGFIVPGGNE